MPDLLAIGREATMYGKPYRIIAVEPRRLILEQLKRGIMDAQPKDPVFDLREAAPVYVRDGSRVLACLVTQVEEVGGKFASVSFVPHGVVAPEVAHG